MRHAPPHGGARRRPRAVAALTAGAGLLAGALLGGCADLRLETPPPAAPSPDATEQVRDATAREAVAVADLATRASLTAPEGVAIVLGRVAEVCVSQADALGGVYAPFPETPGEGTGSATDEAGAGTSPTVTPSAPPPPADATAVLSALGEAADAARSDADSVRDGDLGRFLASVWVSRVLLAEELGAALAAAGDTAAPPIPSDPATPAVPGDLPAGVEATDVLALVRSEDAAGMVWEVVAARSADAARTDAAARAELHRERADAWAVSAGVAGGDGDPRRAAYDLPEALTVDGATAEAMVAVTTDVEAALGGTYTSLVARADAGARSALLDAMLDQVRRGLPPGSPVPGFPGLPERV